MKIRTLLSIGALAAASLTSVASFAQNPTPPSPDRADTRQDKQQDRIQQGKESGELTKREAYRLRAEQRVIKNQEKKAAADGVVTKKESKRIEKMQDGASKDIKRQKHDEQDKAAK